MILFSLQVLVLAMIVGGVYGGFYGLRWMVWCIEDNFPNFFSNVSELYDFVTEFFLVIVCALVLICVFGCIVYNLTRVIAEGILTWFS